MSTPQDPSTPPRRRGRGRGRGRGFRAERGGRSPRANPGNARLRNAGPAEASSSQQDVPIENALESHVAGISQPAQPPPPQSEADDAEVCFICASPVIHVAVAPCNHRTCHICSLRLRALYKTKACAHCRTEADFVVFTDSDKDFQDFGPGDVAYTDRPLGIQYEKKEIREDTVLLLRYNCPDEDCDVACFGWPDLHRHVKSVHHKVMCDLCTRNKKVFTHEHELFTKEELRRHEQKGDDKPGAVDQSGFRGHPICGFCNRRFYDDDELYKHCRERHERCHICDRTNGGRQPQYYVNYEALEDHFRKDHFVCPDRECLEKKFVVFESEMDLKAHSIQEHGVAINRDARRVDLSDFSVRERYQPEQRSRGDRGGRGRGRGHGRDPASEPIPQSSAQPMRRDELAYQRQMAVQGSQSSTTRSFGGQLTQPTSNPAPATSRPRTPANQPVAPSTNGFPSLGELNQNLPQTAPQPPAPLTREEEARQLRHNAVVERASNLLKNDQSKLNQFRAKISAFKNGTITGAELIEVFFSLFDSTSAELGKLVRELADIFEIASKRDELLKAWNDWKAINEDYPSLPGSSSSSTTVAGSSHGGHRVLKLKSSTAQSSRSTVNKTASWGTTSAASLFPSLSSQLTAPVSRARGRGGAASTPWAGHSGPSFPSLPSARAEAPRSTTPSAKTGISDSGAFPALPAAAKPSLPAFAPGYKGSGVRRAVAEGSNAWATPAAGGGTGSALADEMEEEEGAGGKRKGKQNKKQTLMHWG